MDQNVYRITLAIANLEFSSFFHVYLVFRYKQSSSLFLQISFQEFKNKFLEPGLVDHIVVSNKSVAKVYVRNTPYNQTSDDVIQGPANGSSVRGHGGEYKCFFTIGSVDSFEEKLEEAQEALGIDPHDYVPVTYSSDVMWYQELMRFAPTLLLLGTLMYMGRRMQGGLGVGGGGGKGGRGIFNIGKAHVTKVDKNSKNKVSFLFLIQVYKKENLNLKISSFLCLYYLNLWAFFFLCVARI